MKKNSILYSLIAFVVFTILLFTIHFLLIHNLFSELKLIINLPSIYAFHIIVSLLIGIVLIYISKIDFDRVGFAFMALSILKMLAAILFLLPIIRAKQEEVLPDVVNFFIPYFLYLTFEIWFGMKLLNQKEKLVN